METILFFLMVILCIGAYLLGYCAGACDQQKEYANKHSLTK